MRSFVIRLRLFFESVWMAFNSLRTNRVRTFLSLTGVTIGIFAIISVFTMVDSMEMSIRSNVETLGDNVIFIQKWPWEFGSDYPWWKYFNRPHPNINEVEEIKRRSALAVAVCYSVDFNRTVEYENSSLGNVSIIASSHEYNLVRNFELTGGRYFVESESSGGANVCIIGADVATLLFPNQNPIGKIIKINGNKLNIVGAFAKEGESMIGNSTDNVVLIPVTYATTLADLKSDNYDPWIMVKAKEGITNYELKDEITGHMRSIRKLKPGVENNFALNEVSLLSNGIQDLFSTVNWAGLIIGLFSVLVGGFGIANIMFVSVKERTHLIGIQKSLGAKNSFILIEFLSESVILCVVGGLAGLAIIYPGTLITSALFDMEIVLTTKNIFIGLFISVSIGLVSGILPAWTAARLDPVEAIRTS